MTELVTAVHDYAAWLYGLIALLIAREVHRIWRTGRERELAMFGLEREAAIGKAVRSLVLLLLLVTIAAGVYVTAHYVAPALPERELRLAREGPLVEPTQRVPLPTDIAAPTPATDTPHVPRIVTAPPRTPTADQSAAGTPSSELSAPEAHLCRNPDILIVEPGPGDVLVGTTRIVVTVTFEPDSGRAFELALRPASSAGAWTTLVEQQSAPVADAEIAWLDPGSLAPGSYTLRLRLSEPDGRFGDENTCSIQVRVP